MTNSVYEDEVYMLTEKKSETLEQGILDSGASFRMTPPRMECSRRVGRAMKVWSKRVTILTVK